METKEQNKFSSNTLLAVVTSNDREKDIQRLCKQVLNAYPHTYYNPNGADTTTCPFCSQRVDYSDADISDLKHSTDCAYNIAKDLSTGLR